MHRDSCPLDCKVYVGNLGNNGNKTELERSFGYYGPLRSVWVARNPPGFAFVEFEDPRDAADAVRELDGRSVPATGARPRLGADVHAMTIGGGARQHDADPAMHRDSCPLDCKVYVGNLGNNGNKTELERSFGYYGPLRSVWVARNPPGFAFVEFEDPRDAADAVRELDGRVRVELSNGEKRTRNRGPPPSWSRRPRDDNRRRSPPARRSRSRSNERK
ncbi:UNVERIFIED_CONTAM: hypothetical protein FKN15_075430 [Acipenser sinensis]